MLSLHAPLLLENTLPIGVSWSISVPRGELLQDTGSDTMPVLGQMSSPGTLEDFDDLDGREPSMMWRFSQRTRTRGSPGQRAAKRRTSGGEYDDSDLGFSHTSNKVSGIYVGATRAATAGT